MLLFVLPVAAASMLALAGCPASETAPPVRDLGPPQLDVGADSEVVPPLPDNGPPPPPPDAGKPADLPTQHKAPCQNGRCGAKLVCVADVCRSVCTQTSPNCNDKVPECAIGESCQSAGGAKFACVAGKQPGTLCGTGVICEGGSLCVNAKGTTRCLAHCQSGKCPAGEKCVATPTSCKVCLP